MNFSEAAQDKAQILIGLNCSVGIGQVRISTAKRLENSGYQPKTKMGYKWRFHRGKRVKIAISRDRKIYDKLVKDEYCIDYAAAELKYQINRWKGSYKKIANDVAILGTLYNIGNVRPPRANPKPNSFGLTARKELEHVKKLLK